VQIHFVGQGDDLLGAGDDAQLTSLTPLGIHHDFNALNPEFGVQRYEFVSRMQRKKTFFFPFVRF